MEGGADQFRVEDQPEEVRKHFFRLTMAQIRQKIADKNLDPYAIGLIMEIAGKHEKEITDMAIRVTDHAQQAARGSNIFHKGLNLLPGRKNRIYIREALRAAREQARQMKEIFESEKENYPEDWKKIENVMDQLFPSEEQQPPKK